MFGADTPPTYEAEVRGAFFHGDAALISSGLVLPGEGLLLEREPANRADSNAILVKRDNNQVIGYIAREVASRMAPWMDQGWIFMCSCIKPCVLRQYRGKYFIRPKDNMLVRCVPLSAMKKKVKLRVEEPA